MKQIQRISSLWFLLVFLHGKIYITISFLEIALRFVISNIIYVFLNSY